MAKKTINKEIKVRNQSNFKSIFVEENNVELSNKRIIEINRELSKLDRQILKLQNDYEGLLLEKTRVKYMMEIGDNKDASS